MGRIAITRPPTVAISDCELTFVARTPISFERAAVQHRHFESLLDEAGFSIRRLPELPDQPDAVFVEDTAVVLPELAILCRPGAVPRRPETATMAQQLGEIGRELRFIKHPATVDGGDVLVIGRTAYIGQSRRTNDAGIRQLKSILMQIGYAVIPVPVTGCLHLKSAVTLVGEDVLLMNRDWIAVDAFNHLAQIRVDPSEPSGANALRIGDAILYSNSYPRTRDRLESAGISVLGIDFDEMEKAEAGVTCCAVLL